MPPSEPQASNRSRKPAACVTGASGGLGRAIALRLARATQAFPVPRQCRLLRVCNDAAPETAAAVLLDIARGKLGA